MKYFKDKNKFLKYVKNKVTVSLIYGAPCSGKTTFVESILGNDDIMIDLDKIVTCISKFNCVIDCDIDTCIERSKKKADGYDKIVNDWFSKYEEEDQ